MWERQPPPQHPSVPLGQVAHDFQWKAPPRFSAPALSSPRGQLPPPHALETPGAGGLGFLLPCLVLVTTGDISLPKGSVAQGSLFPSSTRHALQDPRQGTPCPHFNKSLSLVDFRLSPNAPLPIPWCERSSFPLVRSFCRLQVPPSREARSPRSAQGLRPASVLQTRPQSGLERPPSLWPHTAEPHPPGPHHGPLRPPRASQPWLARAQASLWQFRPFLPPLTFADHLTPQKGKQALQSRLSVTGSGGSQQVRGHGRSSHPWGLLTRRLTFGARSCLSRHGVGAPHTAIPHEAALTGRVDSGDPKQACHQVLLIGGRPCQV